MTLLELLQKLIHEFLLWLAALAILCPELGDLLRRMRDNETQAQFAERIGADERSLRRWEHGEVPGALFASRIMRMKQVDGKLQERFTQLYLQQIAANFADFKYVGSGEPRSREPRSREDGRRFAHQFFRELYVSEKLRQIYPEDAEKLYAHWIRTSELPYDLCE